MIELAKQLIVQLQEFVKRAERPRMPLYVELAHIEMAHKVSEVMGSEASPYILRYHAATTGQFKSDEIAWCSSFVNWCVREARHVDAAIPKETGVATARSWLNWGKKHPDPIMYSIAVMKRGEPWQGHVGFVVGFDKDTVSLLGGNQSNSVCIQKYNRKEFLGFMTA